MNAPVRIAELAAMLHWRSSRWRTIAVLKAYFDESGTHAKAKITAIAGYIATAEVWASLEIRWKEELALMSGFGVKAFHMTDAIGGGGDYSQIETFHRLAHIKRMSEILRDSDIQAIAVWVDNNAWKAKDAPERFNAAFPDTYSFCFDHIVHWLREWTLRKADGELVAPVFAWHQEYSPRMTALYGAKDWYRDALASITFGFPDKSVPLQTADFIANQWNYDGVHVQYHELTLENAGITPAFNNAIAKNKGRELRGYSADSLVASINRFIKTGRIL